MDMISTCSKLTGTLESTSYDSLFDLKVGYNNALKEVSKLGIEVQNQGLEENKNEEYIATVIIDTNDLDILLDTLTRREQEIPHFYKWWDELRYSWRLLDFCISQYYNLIINQSYSLKGYKYNEFRYK